MKESEIQVLAEQGNPQAIAQILNQVFRPQQIRVMVQQVAAKQIKIQLESFTPPDEAIARNILEPWQEIWQRSLMAAITVEGVRFGEPEPDWQWRMIEGLLSSTEREQSLDAIATVEFPQQAEFQEQDITSKLRQLLKSYLWSIKVTPSNQALVIQLTVIDRGDRQEYCQIIQNALQSLQLNDVEKIYLNVYHRETRNYLFKTTFAVNQTLPTANHRADLSEIAAPSNATRPLIKPTRNAALIGSSIGIVLFLFPLSRFILNAFLTLVHEMGHAIAYWIFGYPAVPSFDFLFGGGITLALNQAGILIFAVYAGIAYLAFRYRRNVRTLIFLGIITVLHLLFLLSGWDEMAIAAMGHLFEIGAIFICLYFALGKYFCNIGGEQTLYAMLASFSLLKNFSFFWQLIFSTQFRLLYRVGKGGILDHDLVRLTQEFLPLNLQTLASLFLLLTLTMPVLAIFAFRYEPRWVPSFYQMCQPNDTFHR